MGRRARARVRRGRERGAATDLVALRASLGEHEEHAARTRVCLSVCLSGACGCVHSKKKKRIAAVSMHKRPLPAGLSRVTRDLKQYASVARLAPEPPLRKTWVDLPEERMRAGRALSLTFCLGVLAIMTTGAVTLAFLPTADADYEGLADRLSDVRCLRAARRADFAVVFAGLGAPSQHLKLLLRLDQVVHDPADAVTVFSERMHKSQTMRCEPFDPPIPFRERCQDVGAVFNGTDALHYVHTRFAFLNDYWEAANYNRAALVKLDGMMRLVAGTTYWLTNTHLCFAPHEPETAASSDESALAFTLDADGRLRAPIEDLAAFAPTAGAPVATAASGECAGAAHPDGARLFPVDAASETNSWLSLSSDFLYEYGHSVLERRREVLEVGRECAASRSDLAHVNALYRIDCDIHVPAGWCQSEAALPFRRLAQHRLRLDVAATGEGTLRAKKTAALARIPYLVSYGEGLGAAFARLVIMLLTAAVVFIRGNQNASSSRYMMEHVLDTVRCRAKQGSVPTDYSWAIEHDPLELVVDVAITLVALLARVLVFAFAINALVDDNHPWVIAFELLGIGASLAHILLRYAVLSFDLSREAPLTKLAGPMSICDVAAAVLLAFSDPPLLSTDDGRFAAVGRLLIGILISISVFSRCLFGASMCALLANTVVNDKETYRKDMKGYQGVLIFATFLWLLQAIVSTASVCTLFVNPAAYAMARMLTGDTTYLRYCLFFGLAATGLPTITKVALRTLEHECGESRSVLLPDDGSVKGQK